MGQPIGIGVYAVADSAGEQTLSGAQVIVGWDPQVLRLSGLQNAGAASLLYSGFPFPDPYGLNESSPPQDGLGIYVAFANLGRPVAATESGTLLTTLMFEARQEAAASEIGVIPMAGMPEGRTTVFDGAAPNRDVTGVLRGATVTVIPAPPAVLGVAGVVVPAIRRRRRHEWHGNRSAVRVHGSAG